MSEVRVLVGTRKGAFVLTADGKFVQTVESDMWKPYHWQRVQSGLGPG